jgi:hypothetical protein
VVARDTQCDRRTAAPSLVADTGPGPDKNAILADNLESNCYVVASHAEIAAHHPEFAARSIVDRCHRLAHLNTKPIASRRWNIARKPRHRDIFARAVAAVSRTPSAWLQHYESDDDGSDSPRSAGHAATDYLYCAAASRLGFGESMSIASSS